jgi:hypothetical protein
MIVGYLFDGDHDDHAKWEQHDAYREALAAIVSICREHVTMAVNLLQVDWPARWPREDQLDHQALQDAHDLLAATWRFRIDASQLRLPFRENRQQDQTPMQAWIFWLRAEVDSWRHAPWLTDKIMTILAEQNTPAGQDVAESLAEQLRERFRDVPWVTAMPRTRMMGALA